MAEYVYSRAIETTTSTGNRSLSALRQTVRRNLNAASDTSYYTDEDINGAINRAYSRLAEETMAYITKAETTTESGVYLYDVPENTIQILNVSYDNERIEKENLAAIMDCYGGSAAPESVLGTPSAWAQYGMSEIWLYRTPNDAKVLAVFAATYPAELSDDSDTSVFVKRGDEYLINAATADLLLRDNELSKEGIYSKRAREDMDKTKRATIHKPVIGNSSNEFRA